ncbi:MAG: UDP-N-acetylmuramoyl-L-alanyl-D-glutamate--2,6-diaminopimelate ligase [Candidatus Nomurabacteria bacterium]|jgi:UDP-N-acetylmuramyl-tripeptide synthetase|nr:UDP-N-acetylmuramoyl-L-alanyl-D-glutamate--2,6-diaminopimelate ligase [Candidatus Nomurabacteria bacterium]
MKKILAKFKKVLKNLPFYNQAVLPYHWLSAFVAATRYDYPARDMTVIGVTGTNGKTTTCNLIFTMLKQAGKKVGLITTVNWGSWKNVRPETQHMTTPSPSLLNRRIRELKREGCDHLVLEVSSHALAQHRILGVPIDAAVFTNLTHEHLDYHKTFSNYRKAKLKLFKRAKFGVVNADDPSAKYFQKTVKSYITYGIKSGEIRAKKLKLTPNYVKYDAESGGETLPIQLDIPGEFNVYNSLAAVAIGRHYNLTNQQIQQGIAALKAVAGRMNRIDEGQDFTVIVDYAHTPDAFEKVLPGLKPAHGRLIALFGMSGGERDHSLRAPIGQIAAAYADEIVLTEDDPRDEPLDKIWNDIEMGIKKSPVRPMVWREVDRTAAIQKAFSLAKTGDTVVLLGMGAQRVIARPGGQQPWDEIATARRLLKNVK